MIDSDFKEKTRQKFLAEWKPPARWDDPPTKEDMYMVYLALVISLIGLLISFAPC